SLTAEVNRTRSFLLRFRKHVTSVRRLFMLLRDSQLEYLPGALISTPLGELIERLDDQVEAIDDARDVVENLNETLTSKASHGLNEVMKTLSSWGAIFVVVSVILAMYQACPFASCTSGWSFGLIMILVVLSGLGLYLGFKRRKWL